MPEFTPVSTRGRDVPRPFRFHWGSGKVIEEASVASAYVEPSIHLVEYEGHPASYGIRFCYSRDGRYQRSPVMLEGSDSLDGMCAALKQTSRLCALPKKLVN